MRASYEEGGTATGGGGMGWWWLLLLLLVITAKPFNLLTLVNLWMGVYQTIEK
jgi:hypothetical protein